MRTSNALADSTMSIVIGVAPAELLPSSKERDDRRIIVNGMHVGIERQRVQHALVTGRAAPGLIAPCMRRFAVRRSWRERSLASKGEEA